ncbi:MAG: MoxR family ATPase [Gammaproteobacteria bacterium]|jgi:MoxR-like ATPase|nr:MoxR family ATPase [Gammaproteobacteria bacterium]
MDKEHIEHKLSQLHDLTTQISQVIVGQQHVIEEMLLSLMSGGHCILEGVPGLAKTLMVDTLSKALKLDFHRVQFTPDLMPSDIIGTEMLEEDHSTGKRFFKFLQGPVFTNVLLADEINRTPPKTQSALLEAMQEHTVSYGGERFVLPAPFFVLATQNPVEQAGTYPLPEAQLDRFLLFIRIDYPSTDEEVEILARTTGVAAPEVASVLGAEDVLELQRLVREVDTSAVLLRYVADIVRATRPQEDSPPIVKDYVRWGAGPRAGQALVLCSKAHALLSGRYAVTLDDIRRVSHPALRHRLLLNFQAEADGVSSDDIVTRVFEAVPEPESPIS